MDTYTVSATELKDRVADILNRVYYEGTETIVNRHGKPIARIVPVRHTMKKGFTGALKKLYGIMPDFPNVTSKRYLRKRALSL